MGSHHRNVDTILLLQSFLLLWDSDTEEKLSLFGADQYACRKDTDQNNVPSDVPRESSIHAQSLSASCS